jgi:hypothetical protein
MKRVAAGIALFTLLLFPALAGASHGSGDGGPTDFAVGGGTTGSPQTGVQHVDFAAMGGPTTLIDPSNPLAGISGEPVTGHFRAGGEFDPAGLTGFQQEGPVTCLVVDGNRAQLVYPVKQATTEMPGGSEGLEESEVLIFLEDNGPPVNGEPKDRIGFVLLPDETPAPLVDESPHDDPPSEQDHECVAPTGSPTFVTLQKGDFNIHEGP